MSRFADEEPDVDEVDSPVLAAVDRLEEVAQAMDRPDPDAELRALQRLAQREADKGDRFAQRDAEGIARRLAQPRCGWCGQRQCDVLCQGFGS